MEEAGTQSIVDDGGSVFLKGEKIVYYWDVHGSDRNWFSKLVYKLFTERIQPTYICRGYIPLILTSIDTLLLGGPSHLVSG